jgi:uncharacterized protein (TIGR03792 family)
VEIERLLFQVTPHLVEDFVTADNQVWLPWLQRQRGFLRKTHSVNPGGMVETLIFWKDSQSRKKAERSPELATIELMFRNRIGSIYRLVSSS